MENNIEPIDLVYLWVDGNDPLWRAKRDAFIGIPHDNPANCKGRYQDNDELKYSLRSVEKYAPWVRNIYIVTDDQTPSWLNTSNPRVHMVSHRDILPPEALPCFNSNVIEHNLYKIPGLSEQFLCANDDMLLNRPVSSESFFPAPGKVIVRLNKRPFKRLLVWYKVKVLGRKLESYNKAVDNAARMMLHRFGHYYNPRTHHNIDAYLKSSIQETHEIFKQRIEQTYANHMRSDSDVNRNLYSYVDIEKNRGVPVYVDEHTSLRLPIHKHELYEQFDKLNPTFFCVNDSQFATDDDRRIVKNFLETRFPDKSTFEK